MLCLHRLEINIVPNVFIVINEIFFIHPQTLLTGNFNDFPNCLCSVYVMLYNCCLELYGYDNRIMER